MYQGTGHIWNNKFNKISDFQERYYRAATDQGARPSAHYRGALRNAARIAYRVAKKSMKQLRANNS